MTDVLQDVDESNNEVSLIWYKKFLYEIKRILLVICNFFISTLKVLSLFLFIAMNEEFGQKLKVTIKASELEYNIAHTIYTVLINVLKVFAIIFIIVPFIFYKFVCGITSNKK